MEATIKEIIWTNAAVLTGSDIYELFTLGRTINLKAHPCADWEVKMHFQNSVKRWECDCHKYDDGSFDIFVRNRFKK